jgi:NAD(P)-dependent dehydrogenase (short-subunit alcohol dehydrogenase family)
VVLITGAASGIGRATAELVGAAGASVMLADQNAGQLNSAADELASAGVPVATFAGDVADDTNVRQMVDAAVRAFGRIDALVTSAGIERAVAAVDMTVTQFEEVLRVNLTGTFLCAAAVARYMCEADRGGTIVTVSSALAFSGRTKAAQYSASKAGVVALTKSLAIEWGPHDSRVNCVAPGLIATPITSEYPQAYQNEYAQRTPLRRIGTPEDVGRVIRFLLSDDAAYVTGQTVVVNGGFLMPS